MNVAEQDIHILQVPMDWQNPSETERVVLGVIKLPAKTKGYSVPPLFINPGVCNKVAGLRPHRLTKSGPWWFWHQIFADYGV